MKKAVQVYLEPDQDRILSRLSKTWKRSKAAIIRACIEDYIAKLPPEEDPVFNIIGLGDSGYADVAEKHDEYLAEMKD